MKSLFDPPPDEFAPAVNRTEPVLWVRRLVIVPNLTTGVEPIREVEFRRGLNIVATATPKKRVDGAVGHNVGKTLLTRLIRYCLGEQHFAREPVRKAIGKAFPEAFVIAEVLVGGRCRIVRRPIGTARSSESGFVDADDWRAILADDAELGRMSAFLELVEQETVGQFAETLLPHQGRAMRWLDLLAWLSRDQYCRYRHPLQWRSAWTESGTVDLHDEDASVVIRLVMDLINLEESRLVSQHKRLLADQTAQRVKVKRFEEQLSRTREFLQQRLKMDNELLADDLFAEAAKSRAKLVKEEIQTALEELPEKSGLKALQEDLTAKQNAVMGHEKEIAIRLRDRQTVESELKTCQTASNDEYAASFADLGNPCHLPVGECPLKGQKQPGERNPFREIQVQQKTAELQRLDQVVADLDARLAELKLERDKAQQKFDRKDREVQTTRGLYETKLWSTNALLDEADQYRTSLRTHQTDVEALTKLEREVADSRESHHAAHEELTQKRQKLNAHFNRVLKIMMANFVQGRIEIDMRGLRLELDSRESTMGEALASETAQCLDLACLSASICGLGHFPRLLIHDSPREADLESHIYARLFEFVLELERSFNGQLASFQYIITTTTPPPDDFKAEPYLRLLLDRRHPDGLLLRQEF